MRISSLPRTVNCLASSVVAKCLHGSQTRQLLGLLDLGFFLITNFCRGRAIRQRIFCSSRRMSAVKLERILFLGFIVVSSLLQAEFLKAQARAGAPPFSAVDSHDIDGINLQNLDIFLTVPVHTKTGAFPLSYQLSATSSSVIIGSTLYVGTQPLYGSYSNYLNAYPQSRLHNYYCNSAHPQVTKFTDWVIQTPDGNTHALPKSDFSDDLGCLNSGFTDIATDGSGYSATVLPTGQRFAYNASAFDTSGMTSSANVTSGVLTMVDSNGNTLSEQGDASRTVTDTLGDTSALSMGLDSGGNPISWSWHDDKSGTPQVTQTNSVLTAQTAFGCPSVPDYSPNNFTYTTGVQFPDNTTLGITYEGTPGNPGNYTGRLGSITLRSGGTISYGYSGGHNGIDCTYGIPPILTRTTSDGTTTYTWAVVNNGSGQYGNTTTVVDNGGNKTVYTFTGLTATGNAAYPVIQALTQVQHYLGTSTLLTTDVYCYNAASGQPGNCATAVVSLPITEVDVYHTINGMSTSSRSQTQYDKYEDVTYFAQYDFGATAPTTATTTVYGSWNGSTCVAISSTINNKPCTVVTTQNGNTTAQSRFTYDSRGNLLTTYVWSGSSWLSNSTPNVHNSNGTIATSYDLANNPTTYAYNGTDGCNNLLPTSVTKAGLTASSTWDCIGGVKLTDTDANSNVTTYSYTDCVSGAADPFWRVMSVTDPLGNKVCKTYPTASPLNTVTNSFTFNSGNSIEKTILTTDSYGRKINSQKAQSPGGANYDTASIAYGWSGNYRQLKTTLPCLQTLGNQCSFTSPNPTISLLDPLGRPYSVTDGDGGVVTTTFTQNDVLTVLSPAPSPENNKQFQRQYDGLGRLQYSCAIGNGSTTPCGVSTGPKGVTTSYVNTYATGSSTTTATRGTQTRTTIVDALGRVTQKVTPEGGTWSYTYDATVGTASCKWSSTPNLAGRLSLMSDPNGNQICYSYDSIGRTTLVNADNTTCRHFYYDNSTGYSGSIPAGVSTPVNSLGRMVEAATDSCAANTLITDEWFSYNDKDGRMTDMWELTPHSGQYYHSVAAFFENGKVKTLQLASPNLYTMTYTLDGEGRWNTLTDTTTGQAIVMGPKPPSAMYNPASQPIEVDLTGTDKDLYTYDSAGRMKTFTFQVGNTPKTLAGTLNWNTNGTLNNLAIVDGFNAGGTQTCNFNSTLPGGKGYDDWGRLLGVDCGSGQWGQTFSYDIYDNLTKTQINGRPLGTTWNPGYNTSNNHCNGCTYDVDGDVTGDGNNVYGWNEFAKLAWTATSGTPTCGSSGRCAVYDAFGRIVEQSVNSTWRQRWITQLGETAYMTGTSPIYAYWPTPGGGKVLVYGNSTSYAYLHPDWLGNARIDSSLTSNTVTTDQAYSPYGELYDIFGSNVAQNEAFAGMTGNFAPSTTTPVMWDTPNRELSMVGRWLSPDPAGAGWNQYAYSTDPNSNVDPSGLGPQRRPTTATCWWSGGCGATADPGWWSGLDGAGYDELSLLIMQSVGSNSSSVSTNSSGGFDPVAAASNLPVSSREADSLLGALPPDGVFQTLYSDALIFNFGDNHSGDPGMNLILYAWASSGPRPCAPGIACGVVFPVDVGPGMGDIAVPGWAAATFEGGEYTTGVLQQDLTVYRAATDAFPVNNTPEFYGTEMPTSATEANASYNISGTVSSNQMNYVNTYTIPSGTPIAYGPVAGGSGMQVYVPNASGAGIVQTGTQLLGP
jgi:hypothetical protein